MQRHEGPGFEDQAAASQDLFGVRKAAQWNEDEQRFSVELHNRLGKLIRGQRNELLLMRKYYNDGNRLGVMATPSGLDRLALRLPVVERMLLDTLTFLHDGTPGSAPARVRDDQNRIHETQEFTTKWPHILLVRKDVFHGDTGEPLETVWCARRAQNQRAQIRINRVLDAVNLGIDLVRLVRFGG